MSTEATALTLAEDHRLPAPRLIAADLAGGCGRLALMTTAVTDGTQATDEIGLRALGALLPTVHAVSVPPHPDLPPRTRAREGDDYVAVRAQQRDDIDHHESGTDRERRELCHRLISDHPNWSQERLDRYLTVPATTPLIQQAERILGQLPHSSEQAGLVHDDVALGNVIWAESKPVLIDWEGAGSGPAGLDLGNARFEIAQQHGQQGADLLRQGWQQSSSEPLPADLDYWDLSAALNTPANLAHWGPDASHRRDAFLRHVLTRLRRAHRHGEVR
ncbi:phosphotransferase [Actinopolymorpha sp. B9G3]|uniref:phosphotransferase family protein n=1 Tax=Actinopolymorpha sp. B9G3 TaxID=3158970 RepID=UPI0032D8F964